MALVAAMSKTPQTMTRSVALRRGAPPACAPSAPRSPRAPKVARPTQIWSVAKGAMAPTIKGTLAPAAKVSADTTAA